MKIVGNLRHVDLEGGVWLLAADDGKLYQLTPPPGGFSAGAAVEVQGDPDNDSASFQMAAPLLRVRSIRAR